MLLCLIGKWIHAVKQIEWVTVWLLLSPLNYKYHKVGTVIEFKQQGGQSLDVYWKKKKEINEDALIEACNSLLSGGKTWQQDHF